MPLGKDQQYDLSPDELDKFKRRQEIYRRLKQESVAKRFDPYLMMKREVYIDPAIERYMDIRKKGRAPGAPLRPSLFFGYLFFFFFGPMALTVGLSKWERTPWLKAVADGTYPMENRLNKHIW